MPAEQTIVPPGFRQLDRRRLEIWPRRVEDSIALRMRRATSWLQRAEMSMAAGVDEGYDSACIFYWISLNAAYAQGIPVNLTKGRKWTDSEGFKMFADRVVERDSRNSLANWIFESDREPVLRLTEGVYLCKDFWLSRNGAFSGDCWKGRFGEERKLAHSRIMSRDHRLVREVLPLIFDRLYVLRNQLIHVGATWRSSVNRSQVESGAKVMASLVPTIISIMLENSDENWGPCFYQPALEEQTAAVQSAIDLPDRVGR